MVLTLLLQQINTHEAETALKQTCVCENAYCSIYNIFILDRFLYIFVPYTLLKFFYNVQDANFVLKAMLRHERGSVWL